CLVRRGDAPRANTGPLPDPGVAGVDSHFLREVVVRDHPLGQVGSSADDPGTLHRFGSGKEQQKALSRPPRQVLKSSAPRSAAAVRSSERRCEANASAPESAFRMARGLERPWAMTPTPWMPSRGAPPTSS